MIAGPADPAVGGSTRVRPDQVVLVVLAKAPVPGEAKTRLTPPYTPHQAAGLAAAALLDTLDAVTAAHEVLGGPTPVVAWSGDVGRGAAPEAVRAALARFVVVDQRGDGLGPRIAAAHVDAHRSTDPARRRRTTSTATLQIGMDTPQVTARSLIGAAGRLTAEDGPRAVLGPATDGGWWVLGLRDPAAARLIVDVAMSTPFTFERTGQALRRGGHDPEVLTELTDVDDAATCTLVAGTIPDSRFGVLARTLAVEPVTR